MRLITFYFIVILLTTNFQKIIAQPKVETIFINQTFLEDRHIRFMYNYAFTNALFDRREFVPTFFSSGANTPDSNFTESILVLENPYRINASDIELFNRSDSIKLNKITHLKNSDKALRTKPLVSQYEFEYLNSGKEDWVENTRILMDSIQERKNSNTAVMFSDVNIVGHRVYLEIIIISIFFPPKGLVSESFIYEFEWCESIRIVYPNRVSSNLFHRYRDITSGKMGGTQKLSSAGCPE